MAIDDVRICNTCKYFKADDYHPEVVGDCTRDEENPRRTRRGLLCTGWVLKGGNDDKQTVAV